MSEIIPIFSRKPLFGYRAFVFATLSIGALSFSVWAHHMFATGAVLLPFFSFVTFLISVPTGVKMFNWIATMYKGKIRLATPMLYSIGFLAMFLIGGINGAFAAVVAYELYLRKNLREALRAGWGTFLGRMAGMVLKLVLSVAMVIAVAVAILL